MQKYSVFKYYYLLGLGFISLLTLIGCKQNKEILSGIGEPIKLSAEVATLRSAITAANYIGTEYSSRKPNVDPNYTNRMKLMRIATDEELLTLSGDTNAVVSLTAFEGLYNRGNEIVSVIFEGYRSRSDMIMYLKGDIAMEMPMLEYAYVYVMDYKMPGEKHPAGVEMLKPKFELSDAEQTEVALKIAELRARNRIRK